MCIRDSLRGTPLKIETAVKNTAIQDGHDVTIYGEQDPGSAGVADAGNFTRLLSGYVVKINRPSTDKVKRAEPVSAQVEAGNVKLVRGPWNKDFLSEADNFPDGSHDDQIDALSGAFNMFNETRVGTFGGSKEKKAPPKPFAGSIARR
jgi:predicted phage terminase large subunit-like protein